MLEKVGTVDLQFYLLVLPLSFFYWIKLIFKTCNYMNKKALQGVLCAFPLGIMYVLYVLYVLYASLWSIFIGWNMNKYTVTATKKAGTTYEGMMTTKEPRVANGLIAIA